MNLQLQYQTLFVDHKLVVHDVVNEHDDFNCEKEYAVQTIKFFSKSKDEDFVRFL